MKLSKTFDVPAPEETAITRIRTYLEQAGYRSSSTTRVSYKRGSLLGSLTFFSPRHWQAEVSVTTQPKAEDKTQVSVTFNVNTTGQWVMDRELRFWDTEVNGLESAAQSGYADYGEAAKASTTAVRSGLVTVLVLMIDIVLIGGVALLAYLLISPVEFTPDNLVVISGSVADYQRTDSGELRLHLSGYTDTFSVSSSNMRFLDEQKFRQDIHGGEKLYLTLTKHAGGSLNQQSNQKAVPVLAIRSDTVTYLPLEPVAAERNHENTVVLPRLLLILIAALIPMLIISARIGLFSSFHRSLATPFRP